MESHERFMKAVNHQKPDRPPINYISTPEAEEKLKKHLGIDDNEALLRRLGADIRYVAGRFVGPEGMMGAAGVTAVGRDFWGVVWQPKTNRFGAYNEIAFHPLASAKTVKEIEQYHWPSVDWFDYSNLEEDIDRHNRDQRRAIFFFVGGAFETPWYMRGLERFLMDLVESPDIAEAISNRVSDFYLKRAMKALEAADGKIDVFYSGGDIGTQRGMMLAPELWRKHIKPYSMKLIKTFKDLGYITFYHSCGSIVPVIQDFIEMGLDILDPIQPRAEGMDPAFLKSQFGDQLTFHGGIDVQQLLPFGSPREIADKVKELIGVLGKNGGYIVAPAHAIQPDTPPENILAMYDAAKEGAN